MLFAIQMIYDSCGKKFLRVRVRGSCEKDSSISNCRFEILGFVHAPGSTYIEVNPTWTPLLTNS